MSLHVFQVQHVRLISWRRGKNVVSIFLQHVRLMSWRRGKNVVSIFPEVHVDSEDVATLVYRPVPKWCPPPTR